jgi:hypothetical protein
MFILLTLWKNFRKIKLGPRTTPSFAFPDHDPVGRRSHRSRRSAGPGDPGGDRHESRLHCRKDRDQSDHAG